MSSYSKFDFLRGGRLLSIICYFAVKANLMIVALKSSIDCTWNRLSDTTSWYPSSSNSDAHLHPILMPIIIQCWSHLHPIPMPNFIQTLIPSSSNFDTHLHPIFYTHFHPILIPIFIQFWSPPSSNFLYPFSSNSDTHLHGQYVKRSCWNCVFYLVPFCHFPPLISNKCFV